MQKVIYIIVLVLSFVSFAQEKQVKNDTLHSNIPSTELSFSDDDFHYMGNIDLDDVIVLPKLKFTNQNELREYLILRRKTRKVWPYASKAATKLDSLQARLERMDNKRQRKKYTKLVQSYLEDEFKDELKKLSKTEGQILMKLLHRQTGTTSFDIVKDLRSGWNAFWYNTTASFFDISMKEPYDPWNNKEDFYIEDILRRSAQQSTLQLSPPAFPIDYFELTELWKEQIGIFGNTYPKNENTGEIKDVKGIKKD